MFFKKNKKEKKESKKDSQKNSSQEEKETNLASKDEQILEERLRSLGYL